MTGATISRRPILAPAPERWPDWPLLAVRCAVGRDVLRGVMVDGGGFNIYLATLEDAMSIDSSAGDRGLTWAEALAERFKIVRYDSADLLFREGWVIDVPG